MYLLEQDVVSLMFFIPGRRTHRPERKRKRNSLKTYLVLFFWHFQPIAACILISQASTSSLISGTIITGRQLKGLRSPARQVQATAQNFNLVSETWGFVHSSQICLMLITGQTIRCLQKSLHNL